METPVEAKDKPLRRDRGSQRKTRVIVMAESEFVESVREGQKPGQSENLWTTHKYSLI